jgi:hypothetical protein
MVVRVVPQVIRCAAVQTVRAVKQRRICWPDFDELCLMGGCIHCNDNPYRGLLAVSHEAHRRNLGAVFTAGRDARWYDRIDYQ